MSESVARAERFEPAPASPFFTWEVSGKPVAVQIPHSIVDRLEKEAVESFRSLSSRGSEIGGLLLGRIAPGQPAVVSVEGYEAVPCDYSRGPLYRLSEADTARMAQAIEQKSAGGVAAVGFFRSQTRKGLGLDADDLELFRTRFQNPGQIALLIRPFATKASMAGIFIWEAGSVQAEASYLEFPFRSSELAASVRPAASLAPSPAAAGPKSAPPLPSAPKAPPRAQIVPIASRRETPAVAPAPPPIEPPVALPETPSAPRQVMAVAETAPAPPKLEAPANPALADPDPEDVTPPPAARAGKMLWVLGGMVSVLLIGGLLVFSGILRRGNREMPNPSVDYSAMALRVERTASELLLTWNRDSEPIRNATHAVLSIHDGSQDENVELDLGQLRNGSIVYSPMTADVVFQMKLTGKDRAIATASVRFLSTRPSPLAAEGDAKSGSTPPKPTDATDGDAATAGEPAAEEEEKPRVLAQATKKFSAESLAQRLHPAPSGDNPEEPALPGASLATAPLTSSLNLGTHNLPAPVIPAQGASAPAPAAEKKIQPGGQIQAAQILRRKDPEYPRLAKDSGAKGTVEMLAMVGADGRVKSVKVLKGHPLLQRAASDAVMQWVYSPAVLNGSPIESQAQIVLNFVNQKQ